MMHDVVMRKVITVQEEAEVTSSTDDSNIQEITSKHNSIKNVDNSTRRKIKLKRKLPTSQDHGISSNDRNDSEESGSQVSLDQEYRLLEENIEDLDNFNNMMEIGETNINSEMEKNDADEVLLLGADDDDYDNITLKAEELLNEIDSLLSN